MVLRNASFVLHVAFALVTLALVGCQTAPVQEMSDARQAISVARDAGAADYAAVELEQAMRFLESAERNLNEHRYANARRDALQAKENALQALSLSEARQPENP